MKLNGVKLGGVFKRTIVFPRESGDLVFTVQAVHDYSSFDALSPMPKPPKTLDADGTRGVDADDPKFKEKLNEWSYRRSQWMAIQSLMATPGLEFEKVKLGQPTTWGNVYVELAESGLAPAELQRLLNEVSIVNGFNEEAIEEAKKRFLARRAAKG
jgi:hypothetical protein